MCVQVCLGSTISGVRSTYLKDEQEDGDEPREPVLRISRHPDDIEKHRPGKKVGELQLCPVRRVSGQRTSSARSYDNEPRTACKDWIASELSCARTPNRKMGRLYAGAENTLVTNDMV